MEKYIELLKTVSDNVGVNLIIDKDCLDVKTILEDIDLDQYPEILIRDLDITKYFDLIVFGYFEASEKIRDKCYPDDVIYIYFMYNKNGNITIGTDNLIPNLWVEYTPDYFTQNINDIIATYNQTEYVNCFKLIDNFGWKSVRAFIGSQSMLGNTFDDFERYITVNRFTENFLWGSYWSDFPFREHILEKRIRPIELARMNTYSLKQNANYNSISVRTKGSKSIIKLENYDGAYIIDITYRPIHNDKINNINDLTNKNTLLIYLLIWFKY